MDWIDFLLWASYFLVFIVAGLCVFFSVSRVLANPKQASGAIYSIVTIGLVLIISFFLANNSVLGEVEVSAKTAKLVGAGLISFYFFLLGTILAILGFEIVKTFK